MAEKYYPEAFGPWEKRGFRNKNEKKKEEKCFRTSSSSSLMHTKAPGGGCSTCEVFFADRIVLVPYPPLMPHPTNSPLKSEVWSKVLLLLLQKMNWICPFGMSIAFLTLLSSSTTKVFSLKNSRIISTLSKKVHFTIEMVQNSNTAFPEIPICFF